MQLFPERIINLWNKCEVRAIILLSLVLQTILIIFGNRRKVTNRVWIKVIVWCAYLSADWVATVALGNLASTRGDFEDGTPIPNNNALQEFWAPFLLLHLGGPDTITAYSLEDNELWLRHFLGLIIQVGVAFYVFLRSWDNSALTFLTIPIFISGVIKYGERTYALWSSSSQHFKDSSSSSPDSCQDFVKFVDDEDPRGKREEEEEEARVIPQDGIPTMVIPQDGIHTEDHNLILAYYLFTRTKVFFAERTLSKTEQKRIFSIIKNKSTAEAFKLVAIELDFMYDVLYTKAAIVYSQLGIILRCITFFSSVCSLVVFSTKIDTHVYPPTDISITYSLLVGAVILEFYAFIVLFLSDWTKLWLIKLKKAQNNPISKTLVDLLSRFFVHSQSLSTNSKRWSESMGQYSIISSCLKKVQPACIQVQKLPFIGEWLENKYSTGADENVVYLQEKILEYLRKQGERVNGDDVSYPKRDEFLTRRGISVITERYDLLKINVEWSIDPLEFVDSLIIWHIATDICYYGDLDDGYGTAVPKLDPNCKIGKCLSDYMYYLLAFRSSMLPKWNGEIRYKETCDEVTTLFKQKRDANISSERMAIRALSQKYEETWEAMFQEADRIRENLNSESIGRESLEMKVNQSLLKHGYFLYIKLQTEVEDYRRWEIISDVWVEMFAYAAHTCEWKQHAQQLRNGGELLTHVCLLEAHFGLSKQYFQNLLLWLGPRPREDIPPLPLEVLSQY